VRARLPLSDKDIADANGAARDRARLLLRGLPEDVRAEADTELDAYLEQQAQQLHDTNEKKIAEAAERLWTERASVWKALQDGARSVDDLASGYRTLLATCLSSLPECARSAFEPKARGWYESALGLVAERVHAREADVAAKCVWLFWDALGCQ
jgi:hypothetical protein